MAYYVYYSVHWYGWTVAQNCGLVFSTLLWCGVIGFLIILMLLQSLVDISMHQQLWVVMVRRIESFLFKKKIDFSP